MQSQPQLLHQISQVRFCNVLVAGVGVRCDARRHLHACSPEMRPCKGQQIVRKSRVVTGRPMFLTVSLGCVFSRVAERTGARGRQDPVGYHLQCLGRSCTSVAVQCD
jgi:hypothetical protein